jgi:AmmeMemoRadiSam system protein A
MPAPDHGAILVAIARASISSAFGLDAAADESASWLRQPGACFVTLMQHRRLRGCIGSLQAHRSLLADLKSNALAAAFHDPRFAPLRQADLASTEIEVSLLSAMQSMSFDSEAGALAQLRPGIDGVVFEYRHQRSTFLPQVWEQLPGATQFMAQLKLKAGLPADFWNPEVRLQRYSVSKWSERAGQPAIAETHQDRTA